MSTLTVVKTKPSHFEEYPWSSVLQNSESETIARNIMTILKRTKNEFRPLTFDEYILERKKDGKLTDWDVRNEKGYFDKVIDYFKSADTAQLFSKHW